MCSYSVAIVTLVRTSYQAVRNLAARFEAYPLPQLHDADDSSISSSDDWATVDPPTARDLHPLFTAANSTNTNNSSSINISATASSSGSSGDSLSWRERWGRKRGTSDAPAAAATATATKTGAAVLNSKQRSAEDAFEKAMESVTCPICLEGVVGAHNTDCSCNKTFCGELLLLHCCA
jgi:hypothetical protein